MVNIPVSDAGFKQFRDLKNVWEIAEHSYLYTALGGLVIQVAVVRTAWRMPAGAANSKQDCVPGGWRETSLRSTKCAVVGGVWRPAGI
jgi:hypothetical protein